MRLASIVISCLAATHLSAAEWIAAGGAGVIESAGNSAFSLRYTADSNAFTLAVLPLAGIPFTQTKSIRFEIKTDSPVAAAVLLTEKKPGGGNYSASIWSNGDTWQPVVLTPADFTVSDGAKDPVDSDNKLDLDEVENIGVLELSQFFTALSRNPDVPLYVERRSGAHLLSVRNFQIVREGASNPAAMAIDNFEHPQPAWFTMGGASFEQHDGTLTIRYRQMADHWITFSRTIPMGDFKGATNIAFDIASVRDAQLVISIRERRAKPGDGPHTDFLVPAGRTLEHREIALSALGELNLANLQSITLLDVSGEDAANTLRIRNLHFVRH